MLCAIYAWAKWRFARAEARAEHWIAVIEWASAKLYARQPEDDESLPL